MGKSGNLQKVNLTPHRGAIVSRLDKRTGREWEMKEYQYAVDFFISTTL
jgi:hypothetical protein